MNQLSIIMSCNVNLRSTGRNRDTRGPKGPNCIQKKKTDEWHAQKTGKEVLEYAVNEGTVPHNMWLCYCHNNLEHDLSSSVADHKILINSSQLQMIKIKPFQPIKLQASTYRISSSQQMRFNSNREGMSAGASSTTLSPSFGFFFSLEESASKTLGLIFLDKICARTQSWRSKHKRTCKQFNYEKAFRDKLALKND